MHYLSNEQQWKMWKHLGEEESLNKFLAICSVSIISIMDRYLSSGK